MQAGGNAGVSAGFLRGDGGGQSAWAEELRIGCWQQAGALGGDVQCNRGPGGRWLLSAEARRVCGDSLLVGAVVPLRFHQPRLDAVCCCCLAAHGAQ